MNPRIQPLLRVVAAGVLTLSLAGVASAADTAMVRVLHASPDAPAVDVYLDDAIVDPLTNVPFGTPGTLSAACAQFFPPSRVT